MQRTETRLGAAAAVGTTYASLGTVPTGKRWNVNLNIAARAAANFRAYIATSSWASGEPAGATLVAAFAYDLGFAAGDLKQVSGIVLNAGEKLVVWASSGSLDVVASGVEVTL